ncbi:MAG: hypothetical protein KAW17_12165 [Candidatus Eisenbacteria sp.]|nr:hypothetical protein [Candidatus Eisenbacteria bacterium]
MIAIRSTWRTLLALVLCLGMTMVVGCFGDDDDEDNNPVCGHPSGLTGTWNLTNAHLVGEGYDQDLDAAEIAELGLPTTIQMNADGSGLAAGSDEFTWCAVGSELRINIPGEGTTTYSHTLSGTTLTMIGTDEAEGQSYTLTLTWAKQ